jgi:hypothetical protein
MARMSSLVRRRSWLRALTLAPLLLGLAGCAASGGGTNGGTQVRCLDPSPTPGVRSGDARIEGSQPMVFLFCIQGS